MVADRGLQRGDLAIVDFSARRVDTGEDLLGATRQSMRLDTDDADFTFLPGTLGGEAGRGVWGGLIFLERRVLAGGGAGRMGPWTLTSTPTAVLALQPQPLAGIVDIITGMRPGEEREAPLRFPTDGACACPPVGLHMLGWGGCSAGLQHIGGQLPGPSADCSWRLCVPLPTCRVLPACAATGCGGSGDCQDDRWVGWACGDVVQAMEVCWFCGGAASSGTRQPLPLTARMPLSIPNPPPTPNLCRAVQLRPARGARQQWAGQEAERGLAYLAFG